MLPDLWGSVLLLLSAGHARGGLPRLPRVQRASWMVRGALVSPTCPCPTTHASYLRVCKLRLLTRTTSVRWHPLEAPPRGTAPQWLLLVGMLFFP